METYPLIDTSEISIVTLYSLEKLIEWKLLVLF